MLTKRDFDKNQMLRSFCFQLILVAGLLSLNFVNLQLQLATLVGILVPHYSTAQHITQETVSAECDNCTGYERTACYSKAQHCAA